MNRIQQAKQKVLELAKATHDPDANKKLMDEPGAPHIMLLFNDGEVVSTKGGPLFGQRTFHMYHQPLALGMVFEFPEDAHTMKEHKYIFPKSEADALDIRVAMCEVLVEQTKAMLEWEKGNAKRKSDYEKMMAALHRGEGEHAGDPVCPECLMYECTTCYTISIALKVLGGFNKTCRR